MRLEDESGLAWSDVASVEIYPSMVEILIDSQPTGRTIFANGIPRETPYAMEVLVGYEVDLSTSGYLCDENLVFENWLKWDEPQALTDTSITFAAPNEQYGHGHDPATVMAVFRAAGPHECQNTTLASPPCSRPENDNNYVASIVCVPCFHDFDIATLCGDRSDGLQEFQCSSQRETDRICAQHCPSTSRFYVSVCVPDDNVCTSRSTGCSPTTIPSHHSTYSDRELETMVTALPSSLVTIEALRNNIYSTVVSLDQQVLEGNQAYSTNTEYRETTTTNIETAKGTTLLSPYTASSTTSASTSSLSTATWTTTVTPAATVTLCEHLQQRNRKWKFSEDLGICAGSVIDGTCKNYRNSTYNEAQEFCELAGARLCSAAELYGNAAKGTGCALDSHFVWTSTSCGEDRHLVARGADGQTFGRQCQSKDLSTFSVRCCASNSMPVPTMTDTEDNFPTAQTSHQQQVTRSFTPSTGWEHSTSSIAVGLEGKCTIHQGVDYKGNDIESTFRTVDSVDVCADNCLATEGCTHFTYRTDKQRCFLKSSSSGQRSKAGSISGNCKGIPTVAIPTAPCTIHQGVDYKGNDIESTFRTVDSVDVCADNCLATEGCTHFTYRTDKQRCFLKSSSSGQRSKAGSVSGACQPRRLSTSSPCTFYNGVSIVGSRLEEKFRIKSSVEKCAEDCLSTNRCTHFVFKVMKKRCFLMSSMTETYSQNGEISGNCSAHLRKYRRSEMALWDEISTENTSNNYGVSISHVGLSIAFLTGIVVAIIKTVIVRRRIMENAQERYNLSEASEPKRIIGKPKLRRTRSISSAI